MRDRDIDTLDTRAGRMRIPRSRGATSGVLLVLLGLWGALIPFVGPYLNFAYDPNRPWVWTPARGWLELLPGAVTVLGGLLLLASRNRAAAMLGGWLAVVAGAWFVIGRSFATPLGLGDFGAPVRTTQTGIMATELALFTGLGTLIVAIGAMGLGRLSVRSVRDIRYARRSVDDYRPAEFAGREPIARERVAVTSTEPTSTDPEPEPERRRGLFGGSRRHHPIPH